MTLDNDSWSEFFDSLNGYAERLKAAVTLARVPLSPARAGRPDAMGGLLEAIHFDSHRDEIQVAICRNGTSGATVRYFVAAPRFVTVESSELTATISITDAEGVRTLISLASGGGELDVCRRFSAATAA